MNKIISMLTKMQLALLAMFMLGLVSSCSDDDDSTPENPGTELTPEELAEMAAADRFAAANSVIRALALIDELPDDWETSTFAPEEGVAIDEANPDIRYMISSGVEYARDYFLAIVPDEGLNGDNWSHEGVGTLTFREVNKSDCYAVIDVDLKQMPGLKQLRFVPEEMVGENKFYGEGYYKLGDVVRDSKARTWICVRPSGGPDGKRHAYFVSFDKSLIKTKKLSQTIYNVDRAGRMTEEENKQLSGTWTYATNLVEERTAIAAGYTFALLAWGDKIDLDEAWDFRMKGKHFEENKILELEKLASNMNLLGYDGSPVYCIPYGSYKSYKHAEVTQVKNIQPTLLFFLERGHSASKAQQIVLKTWPSVMDVDKPQKYVYTLTSDYDPLAYHVFNPNPWDGIEAGHGEPFNIMNYTTDHQPFMHIDLTPSKLNFCQGREDGKSAIPLLMTQKCIKDEGKPYSGFYYKMDSNFRLHYWEMMPYINRLVYEPLNWGKTYRPYD